MKTLSIDIETYSDVPLQKTGVYRYVESPNFEILLFAYSVDSQPVQVIDLACGEQIPKEILLALEDESVIKWAFNATFERICLSRFLGYPTGEYLEPESWRCSCVWAATMGLPLSLEGVGAVLGLEKQKLSEGKDLIKYFCQPCAPTKTNGQRTRNRPFHAPDKWAMFKKYNIRDVETEMGIQQRLAKFPVSAQVWDEYHLDQEINDRGVRLDMELVAAAIEMDTRSRTDLTDAMKKITKLENPNSVQQMKAWLSDNGCFRIQAMYHFGISLALYGRLRPHHANLAVPCLLDSCSGSRPYHSDHRYIRLLLHRIERKGACRIAGNHDCLNILRLQEANNLPGEPDNIISGLASIGNSCRISKIHHILHRKLAHDFPRYRQPSHARVKHSYRRCIFSIILHNYYLL